jgi:hypothetical protein
VIVMHVLRRPHLPHLVEVTLIAALLAVVLTLVLVSAVSPGVHPSSGLTSTGHRAAATAPQATSRWLTHPLAPLASRRSPSPWIAAAHSSGGLPAPATRSAG